MFDPLFIPYEAYYPDCVLPSCEQTGTHQHVLPKQLEVMESTAKYVYGQGGVGSSKSLAFAAKSCYLSLTIPKNEGVVCRKNYKELYKSSWRDVKACLQRLVDRGYIPEPKYTAKTQGDYSQCTLYNGSILYAIQGKNWSDALGPTYGWFWVDDGMESFEELFIGDETSAGLLSRLRLPHVHYHKLTYNDTDRKHGSLHGMVSSNPPPVGHWLHKLFGKTPGHHKIGDDIVDWIQTATFENPFVGADYATGLMAVQQRMHGNAAKNNARRVIFGESIPAYGGIKVYPQFDEVRHVAPVTFDPSLPLVRGWDFGFHHPAVVFSNLYRCPVGKHHYFSISEVSDVLATHVWDLYKSVKAHTVALYSQAKLILDAGDRAGYRRNDSNHDKRGPIKILQEDFKQDGLRFHFRWLDLDSSLEYMRGLLNEQCKCGQEMIQIAPACQVLIGALQGGYKYSKSREGKVSDRPVEDRWFADIACGWRYGAENFVKWGVPHEHRHALSQQVEGATPVNSRQKPWQWMELTDKEMGQLLLH